MITNSQPWDNLKFDRDGVDEVRRKFFGTLYNTYSFFALYANVDGFTGREAEVPVARRPEIDRWIVSLLNTLVADVTGVARRLRSDPCGPRHPGVRVRKPLQLVRASEPQAFLGRRDDRGQAGGLPDALHLSGDRRDRSAAPFAPFISERIFRDLNAVSGRHEGRIGASARSSPTADPNG